MGLLLQNKNVLEIVHKNTIKNLACESRKILLEKQKQKTAFLCFKSAQKLTQMQIDPV